MISLLHAVLAASACVVSSGAPGGAPDAGSGAATVSVAGIPDSTYRRLFDGGLTMEAFLAAAKARKEQWATNYGRGVVADAVLSQSRSAPGPWRLLVVAVDGCSDSVNTVPYIARLVEQLMGVELRIVDNVVGRPVMDAHRTPDGRGATPTVILLDANFEERGCWVERPAELRDWMLEHKGKAKDSELFDHKMAWYEEDKGVKTLADIAAMFEAAGKHEPKC